MKYDVIREHGGDGSLYDVSDLEIEAEGAFRRFRSKLSDEPRTSREREAFIAGYITSRSNLTEANGRDTVTR